MAIAVELKYSGFRCLAQKKGNQVRIEFEDTRKDVSAKYPILVKALMKSDRDVILDSSLGIIGKDGKPWPRIRLMTLTAAKPVIPKGAHLLLTAFDILYDGEDVTELPLSERRPRLEAVVRKIGDKHVDVSQQVVVKTKAALEKAAKRLAGLPGSEGIVVKEWGSPYPKKRATGTWAKLKHAVEVLGWVLETKKTKSGTYNFRGGLLLGSAKFKNVVDFRGRKVVDLGYSFNASFSAQTGDIVCFEVEEIILQRDGSLAWLGAKPISKEARKEPYYAKQVVGMAKRGHVLQDARGQQAKHRKDKCMRCDNPPEIMVIWADGRGRAWFCKKHYEEWLGEEPRDVVKKVEIPDGRVQQARQMEEGETRGARSAKFWKDHWHEMMPMSGSGVFVYQHHWRGLSEEEAKLSEEELLRTKHSVHGDLRCSFGIALWGFTIFLGTVDDVRGGRDLATLPHDDGLEGQFKLSQPKAWLTIATKEKPYVVAPGGPGTASRSWAAFFLVDKGEYELGVVHRSFVEIWLKGDKIKGRYLIQKAQAPDGRRYWQIVKAEKQVAYASEHTLEETVKRLKARGHTLLYWSKPGEKLERIDLTKWKSKDGAE